MIYSLKKSIFFIAAVIVVVLQSCKNSGNDADFTNANLKADSLSIKLNSPELKAVNAELLKDPNNANLYHKRAMVYIMLKQLPEAVGDGLRAIKIDSTRSEYYLTLVDAYFAENKTKLARDLLVIIEKKFPDNQEGLLKLAELYFLIQKYQDALDYANKALKLNENLASGYYLKANVYRETGDTAKAISSLQTTIEQDSKFKDAFLDLGIIYGARKNPLAFEYYTNALKLEPNNEQVLYARAKLLQDLGKTEEAIAAYDALLIKNKNCTSCLYNTGALYLEIKKDNKKALEYFTKAIVSNPSYTEAYFARGLTYVRLKDKASAKADYEMCIKLQPNYEPALQGLNNL